jgi:hypothetical protein
MWNARGNPPLHNGASVSLWGCKFAHGLASCLCCKKKESEGREWGERIKKNDDQAGLRLDIFTTDLITIDVF